MKTDFALLIKNIRIALRPDFKTITLSDGLTTEQLDQALAKLEEKRTQLVIEGGYTQEEFDALYREYYMDFTSDNPDEWVIKHDPENPVIVSGN